MTREEVATLLATIQASWPQLTLTEPTILMWAHQLRDLDPTDALAAVQAIIRTDERPPTIARLVQTANRYAQRRHEARSDARGLPERPTSKAQNLAHLRAARALLRDG